MAADHVTAHNALTAAVRGRWTDIPDALWFVCKKTRAGLLVDPGSENIGIMAWGAAYIIAKVMPRLLPAWMRRNEPGQWWEREMGNRRDHGLMLSEEDARIYCGWHFAPVAAVWAHAEGSLKRICHDWMRCFIARSVLCAVPVKPRRYVLPVDAKLNGEALFVPRCGARSWSAEQEDSDPRLEGHHLGSSAFESILGAIVFNEWRPKQPAHQWELDIMSVAGRPDLFTADERGFLRKAVVDPGVLARAGVGDIADMAGWAKAKWPGYYVRFERGGACIRYGRAVTVSTAPLYAMAIHDDGTIHYLALEPGNRHDIDREPCGMDFQPNSPSPVQAWAGGEGRPISKMTFQRARWGDPLWIVDVGKRGTSVVWPEQEKPPAPPPPNPPEPPEGSPRDRDLWDYPGIWLTKLWRWIEGWL